MKKLHYMLFVLILLMPLTPANAEPISYALQVEGLACPFCAYGIEKKLSTIEGVKDIEVDVKQGEIIVTMAEGATMSEELAREKVEDAGFSLRSMAQRGGSE